MNIEDYREFCLSLGVDVEERMPFGTKHRRSSILVFYVCGHMFSYFDIDDFRLVTLKCQPERIDELKENHAEVTRPYNCSPKYWIGVTPDIASDVLLKELTRNSYEIVKTKYTKKK